jgi:hypothetical protein
MTPRWIVRRSHFPLALPGEKLCSVEAHDKTAAAVEAAKVVTGAFTVEPESRVNPQLERVVERAVKAAGRRDRRGPYGRGFSRAKPMDANPDGDAA